MPVNYDRLWKLLIDKNMKKTDLINRADISSNVLAKLGKNHYVSLESLEKICHTLQCSIEDIMVIELTSKKGKEEETK